MEEKKTFHLGILVGRFQTLHLGHEKMVRTGLGLCDRVGIFVGSSQESGTNRNPFSYALREELLRNVFGSQVEIYPLPDIGVGNTCAWGEYVLENVKKRFGCPPDLLISGKEERRTDWFSRGNGLEIAELYIPKTIQISASRMRQLLLDGNRAAWEQYVNPANHPMFDTLRAGVLASMGENQTQSI